VLYRPVPMIDIVIHLDPLEEVPPMQYTISDQSDFHILEIEDYVSVYNIDDFKRLLFDATGGTYKNVAIELQRNNTHMDSSVISALISAQKKMKALGGQFVLLNIAEELKNIFILAGLRDFFTIFGSRKEII
jgi:anti-anti-sigma factor